MTRCFARSIDIEDMPLVPFAIRQMLGHTNLPQFVGTIDDEAPYRPEQAETK